MHVGRGFNSGLGSVAMSSLGGSRLSVYRVVAKKSG